MFYYNKMNYFDDFETKTLKKSLKIVEKVKIMFILIMEQE